MIKIILTKEGNSWNKHICCGCRFWKKCTILLGWRILLAPVYVAECVVECLMPSDLKNSIR